MGLLAPLLISAGSSVLGQLLNKKGKPEVPDLTGITAARFDRTRAKLGKNLRRQADRLREDLAAVGATGSGGVRAMESLIGTSSDALSDLSAQEAAALSQARAEQERLKFGIDSQEFANRAQGISDLASGVGQAFLFNGLFGKEDAVAGAVPAAEALTQFGAQDLTPEAAARLAVLGPPELPLASVPSLGIIDGRGITNDQLSAIIKALGLGLQ